MTSDRPFLKLSVVELESMHAVAPLDQGLSELLVSELAHRTTDRSRLLQQRIRQALAAHAPGSQEVPIAASAPLDRFSQTAVATPSQVHTPAVNVVAAGPAPAHAHPFAMATNEPLSILANWVALEALSPQTYRRPADLAGGDRRCVVPLDEEDLPWLRDERSRPKYQLYYQVVLGCIPVDRATDALIETFGQDEEKPGREQEKAAIAVVMVDRAGVLLEDQSVAVSSFAWALPVALGGDLGGLGAWATAERGLVEGLRTRLSRADTDGKPQPLDGPTIDSAFRWLVEALGLPQQLYEEPSFALRVFHYFKSKGQPELALLNSFFLADLGRASKLAGAAQLGQALRRYVGSDRVTQSANLLEDHRGIEELVAPMKTPAARWPSPGGHPLVTLQQAAVNAVRSELAESGAGIVAVNGPPGTGKTTLLRDVVAACVLDRASAMAEFDDPLSAFKTTGQKVAAGDRAFLHLYRLDDSLKGHEVLVASSNNKAVENVSKELPALKAVGRDLSYFRSVSDRLMARRAEDGSLDAGEPTWGLIAAVLGNATNRSAFQQAVWWDDDRSLRLYLKAAKGDAVVREAKDDDGNVVKRQTPTIVLDERPPTPDAARANWQTSRAAFRVLRSEVESALLALESIREKCRQLAPTRAKWEAAAKARDAALVARDASVHEVAMARATKLSAEVSVEAAMGLERQAFLERPGWLARLFSTARFKRWYDVYTPIVTGKKEADLLLARAMTDQLRQERTLATAMDELKQSEARLAVRAETMIALEADVERQRQALGPRLVDRQFFESGHECWNLAVPWVPDSLHRRREDLFASALGLHRAFIDVAAQKVSHNLGVLMGAMQAGAFDDAAKKALLGDLWSTLFLVVPVLSTTFASVDRMMGDLPPSSLGWLLIDEAGQATPQAAVGALMRAKRAVVVGDPLQVPPVVSLPQRLVVEVARYFHVEPARWAAPEASVQTVSDQASRLRAEFRADVGVREVGLPLLVHRRCQEPMFGISNRIAYDGQMVHAAGAVAPGAVARVLGPSAWLDVDGEAESKWCAAEGEVVVELLTQLATAGMLQPDVYLITPFRIVAQELRRRLEAQTHLFKRLGVEPNEWLGTRVGTIHTFQGKEAESVIAVLGAPARAHQGARHWATSTPNILNVMVSRARNSLYVVGSKAAWGHVGHGRELAASLPSRRI